MDLYNFQRDEKLKKLELLLGILVLFGLYSCGNKTTTGTKINFKNSFSVSTSLSGGGYFLAKNHTLNKDFAIVINEDTKDLELDNGDWTFLAIGWDGIAGGTPNNKLEGKVRCAQTKVNLNGEDREISLSLSQAACNSTVFGPSVTRSSLGTPLKTIIKKCGDNLYSCSNSTPLAVKVVLNTKSPLGDIRPGLESRCIVDQNPVTPEFDNSLVDLKLLYIAMATDFNKATFKFYSDTSCNNLDYTLIPNRTPVTINTTGTSSGTSNWAVSSNGSVSFFLADVPICATNRGRSNTPFNASGTNMICNKEQLQNISTLGLLTQDIKLLQNLDFQGASFNSPIIAGNFSGNVDGNFKQITNLVLDGSSSSSSIGVFQTIAGNGTIKNLSFSNINLIPSSTSPSGVLAGQIIDGVDMQFLNFDNINITSTSGNKVGTIAGEYNFSSATSKNFFSPIGSLKNINLNIQDGTDIGAAFGSVLSGPTIFGIQGLQLDSIVINLSGSNTNIGGAIGNLANPGFSNIAVNNLQINNPTSDTNSSNKIGGIIGMATSTVTGRQYRDFYLTNSQIGTETLPLYNISFLGGAIGHLNSTASSTIQNIKVQNTSIHTYKSGASPTAVGGIIGKMISNSSTFNNLIFDGTIKTDLSDTGGIVGQVSATGLNTTNIKSFGEIQCAAVCGGIIGKQSSAGGQHFVNYSSMKITSTSNTVGGLYGTLTEQDLNEVSFEGEVSGTNTIGGIVGSYSIGSANPMTFSAHTNAIVDNVTSAGVFAGKIDNGGLGGSPMIMQTYLNAVDLSGNPLSNLFGSILNSTTISMSPGDCIVNQNTPGPVDGCDGNTNMADATFGFLASPGHFFKLNSNGVYELLNFINLKEINQIATLGVPADPYRIGTPAQWNMIKDNMIFMNSSFLLENDLDFTGINFVPIGSSNMAFGGYFVGNGMTIRNINKSVSGASEPLGLFAQIGPGAKINDDMTIPRHLVNSYSLKLENVKFDTDYYNLGALAGYVSDGASATSSIIIKNIKISGDYNDSTSDLVLNSGAESIGGAIGKLSFSNSLSLLENIKVEGLDIVTNGGSAGGVIGNILPHATSPILQKLLFNGTITGSPFTSSPVGGVFADLSTTPFTINEVVSHGMIQITSDSNIGGIFGKTNSTSSTINIMNAVSTMHVETSHASGNVGCIGGTSAGGLSISRSLAMCTNLIGATKYGITDNFFTSGSEGNIFHLGEVSDTSSNYRVLNFEDFKRLSTFESLLGVPWPEYIYPANEVPYLAFEKK